MRSEAAYIDDWLERAFRLAYFLHGDRETAKTIAVNAMNKLETASNAQFKRMYYTPTGRVETSRASRSRVALNDLQLLQRLVFIESENFERQKEEDRKIDRDALLKYFLKHLVRISLKRNSFYVALAVTRILHNYGTADAMEIYNVVVQDPDRVHDDYYYRSRKGVLMKELKQRFGDLLKVVKGTRGEERFEADTLAARRLETARKSLDFFKPWNTSCSIPDEFDPLDEILYALAFDKDDPDEEHRIEINRIHALLHPECFDRITAGLQLDAPRRKMEIPKFMSPETSSDSRDSDDWRNPPSLCPDELKMIKDALAAEAASRKTLGSSLLHIVVDGCQLAAVDLTRTDSVKFDFDGIAEMIEVRAAENSAPMATHLLSHVDIQNGVLNSSVLLEGGQKVTFGLKPTMDEHGEIDSFNCEVTYTETALQRRLAAAFVRAKVLIADVIGQGFPVMKPVAAFGLLILFAGVGWVIYKQFDDSSRQVAGRLDLPGRNSNVVLAENSNKDNPETEPESAPESNTEPLRKIEKPKPKNKRKVRPEGRVVNAPPKETIATDHRGTDERIGPDEDGVLRSPVVSRRVYDDRPVTRHGGKIRGKTLNRVKTIYLELTGDRALGAKISEQAIAQIQSETKFTFTDRETADAALKIDVRATDADKITAVVRLVNAEGFVIYPRRGRVTGWKYTGLLDAVSSRISRDLANAARNR